MGEKKEERCVNKLDIVLPFNFVEETLAVHSGTSNTAYPWEGKTTLSKHYKIVTSVETDGEQKLLHVSIQNTDLNSSEDNITCKLIEIERDMTSLVWSERCASDSPHSHRSTSFHSKPAQFCKLTYPSEAVANISDFQGNTKDNQCSIPESHLQSSNSLQTSMKRKRGRPKKSEMKKDKENKLSSSEKNSQVIANNTGSRYGLRGVKLSEIIMRAEKGLYSDHTTEHAHQMKTEKTEEAGQENSLIEQEIGISEAEQDVEKQNMSAVADNLVDNEPLCQSSKVVTIEEEGYWGEILSDDDQEFFMEKRKKRGRPRKSNNGTLEPAKRIRNKLDLGDSIPVFERRKRNKDKKSECKYCQKKFCDYTGVDAHVRKYHSSEEGVDLYLESIKDLKAEQCSICDQKFEDRIQLQYHENRNHFRGQPVKCNKCKKMYKNFLSLRNHVTAVHSVKGQPHLCHLCPAKFKWAVTLRQHIDEIHEGKMDFICKICNKAFSRKPQLKRHERIHGVDQSKKTLL